MKRYRINGSYTDNQLVQSDSIEIMSVPLTINRYYSSTTIVVPEFVEEMDICLVSGGGASGSWVTWGYGGGGPGGGGQVLNYYGVKVTPGESLILNIGLGGSTSGAAGTYSSVTRKSDLKLVAINTASGKGGTNSFSGNINGSPGSGGNNTNTCISLANTDSSINYSSNGTSEDISKSIYEFNDTSLLSHAAPGFYWTNRGFHYTSTCNTNNGKGTGGNWTGGVSRDGYGGQGAGGGAGGGGTTNNYNEGGNGAVIIRYGSN